MDRLAISVRSRSIYVHYNCKIKPPFDMNHYHLHNDFEFHWLEEGERLFMSKNGSILLKKHTLLIISPHFIHRMKAAPVPEHARYVVNFQPAVLSNELKKLAKPLLSPAFTVLQIPQKRADEFNQLFMQLLKEYNSPATKDSLLYQQSLLSQLLIESKRALDFTLHMEQQPLPALSEQTRVASQLIQHIERHYQERLDLNRLASHVHLSPSYVSRLFKHVTGTRLSEYIQKVRIAEACKLLEESSLPVKIVCQRAGFASLEHFHRVFKRIMAVSPIQYRHSYLHKNRQSLGGK
ncbi:AraC family transcriptional regulator [Shouchella clausii]|uniref:AraC family transcriptional regulator n=1 Tax=Shouchella clausii TaxID=79880 RepID=UPI0021479503|nr:AraC family transcriptional regulator [Shouchella clausii]MCR1289609.1 AraC family transcriptional regulator [Shouchella clausii]